MDGHSDRIANSRFLDHSSTGVSSHDDYEIAVDEERKGLLSSTDAPLLSPRGHSNATSIKSSDVLRKRIRIALFALGGTISLIVTGMYVASLLPGCSKDASESAKSLHFNGQSLRSNGTHDFKRTVLLVSIDGLRADYLERDLTPHLLDISKQGLRAKSMKPIFPTLTFPNHWALMTGLYAESHGIVANNFWDKITDSEFHYNQIASCWKPHWWFGEPIWETAGKAGVINANLMWPGPPKTMTGATPSYFLPWRDKVPLSEKLHQILSWIDLPLEERPQLIMAYEPSLDQAGHATGPYSALVNDTLRYVDTFAKDLHTGLVDRNLTNIVDIVFVSDHGMTDTSHPEFIYMDDILGEQGWASIEHEDGWPSMGLHFNSSRNAAYYLEVLRAAAANNKDKFEVFTPETMPERYHFARSPRIAPVYVVPKIGYVLTTRKEGDVGLTKGNHGYDNNDLSMHAMFVAHGPFSSVAKAVHQTRSRGLLSRALSRPNKGWHSTSDDTYVMNTFQNVEIYNLVTKLLGIEQVASTNGTQGFWDKYF